MANCLSNPRDPATIKAFRKLAGISSDKCHLRVKIGNEKLR
ncbi:hypothetical protein ALC62_04784 [Cyphomyrmex costatus]|uniref:Uncharacterized protein n=1 Tax=Cyphomyrmex costatus TaxID=456900 RepID=A0A195CTM6_9HYME|nr:hypothetical protein ALC62_04784 [Cyphomyrmex costatus]